MDKALDNTQNGKIVHRIKNTLTGYLEDAGSGSTMQANFAIVRQWFLQHLKVKLTVALPVFQFVHGSWPKYADLVAFDVVWEQDELYFSKRWVVNLGNYWRDS